MYWRIFPPSVGEFAEISGKLTLRDGQSAAVVIIQVSINITHFYYSLCSVCVGGVGWLGVVDIPEFVVVVYVIGIFL